MVQEREPPPGRCRFVNRTFSEGYADMRTILLSTASAALLMAGISAAAPAQAKGCIKGAVVGGVAGHVAGHHGLVGAGAGCAVGHHMANKKAKEAQTNPPS